MTYVLDETVMAIAQTAQKILGVASLPAVEAANPKFGADMAIPTFAFARELGKNPPELAQQLSRELKHDAIARCEPAGGFVNVWLRDSHMARGLHSDIVRQGQRYGEHDDGKGKAAIVEFPSPNMAKPFSVGHLRPSLQGWAMTKLMQAMGYHVITDNHLGDWGTPFGKWVVGFQRYSSDDQLERDGVYELARVYVRITSDLQDEKQAGGHQLADEVQDWLLRLEKGDAQAAAYSKRFSELSLAHMHHVMRRLGIATDYEYGEAFYIPEGKRLVAELVERGIARRQPDGSVIVPLDEYGIDVPLLLQKSNGAALYATSDLATLKFRHDKWHPDKVIYVVAAEQQFHFRQVFALADKLGYKSDYYHYWFGLIDQLNDDGTRAKMSSRKGVVLLEELLDQAEVKAREFASASNTELPSKAIAQIALGAVKFTDFAQDKKTAILFDWDRIFNLHGFSGPYVQYAAVRVRGILRKFGEGEWSEQPYEWAAEHDVLLQLARYPGVVKDAAAEYEPHQVAQYLYDLARILNQYYEQTPVGNEPDAGTRGLRLWLLGAVLANFQHGLGLLGIEIPDKM